MSKTRKTVLYLLLVGLGVLGGVLALAPFVQVVWVARTALAEGEVLREPERQFVKRHYWKKQVPANAVTSLDAVRNRVLMQPLAVGDVCTLSMLSERQVPAGQFAVMVQVQPGPGYPFNYFGDRMDLMITEPFMDDPRTTISRILVEKAYFLGWKLILSSEANTVGNPIRVVLAVSAEDLVRIKEKEKTVPVFGMLVRRPGDGAKVENAESDDD